MARKRGLSCILADRHDRLLDAIEELLVHEGYSVAGRALGRAAAESLIEEVAPDFAVVDLTIPDVVELALRRPEVVFVLHKTTITAAGVRKAFQAGVRGLVLKGSPPGELLEAIAVATAGGSYVDSRVSRS
jgi:DNA-binding NarL/FixJ family response regulator